MKKRLVGTSEKFIILNNQPVFKSTKRKRDNWKDDKFWIYLEVVFHYKHELVDPNSRTPRKVERIRRRFNSGEQIMYKNWDRILGEPKSGLTISLMKFRNKIKNKVYNILTNQEIESLDALDKELITVLDNFVKDENKKIEHGKKTLIAYIEEYIQFRKERNTPWGTLKEFGTVKNRINEFQKSQNKYFTFEDINLSFSDNLIKFLSNKEYHPNTIKKTFEILITILNHYYNRREELMIDMNDKFKSSEFGKVTEVKSKPIALNDIEIELIRTVDLAPYKKKRIAELEKEFKKGKYEEHKHKFLLRNVDEQFKNFEQTRKRMLLQMSTGLRVSDLFRIKPSNKKGDLLVMRPKKTLNTKEDNTIYIPLNSISKEVLEPLHYDSGRLKITPHKYNKDIKDFLELIEINEEMENYEYKGIKDPKLTYKKKSQMITSHNLRDTFISKAIRQNVPIPMILKATGQSSYEVMKKYIDLNNDDLVNQMKSLF